MQPDARCPTCGRATGKEDRISDRRGLLVPAVKVAVVVGTCLILINQSGAIFAGASTDGLWWKVPLTFAVPFCVSLYSGVSAMRARE